MHSGYHVHSWGPRRTESAPEPLELELQAVVSLVDAGNQARLQEQQLLSTRVMSPAPSKRRFKIKTI